MLESPWCLGFRPDHLTTVFSFLSDEPADCQAYTNHRRCLGLGNIIPIASDDAKARARSLAIGAGERQGEPPPPATPALSRFRARWDRPGVTTMALSVPRANSENGEAKIVIEVVKAPTPA